MPYGYAENRIGITPSLTCGLSPDPTPDNGQRAPTKRWQAGAYADHIEFGERRGERLIALAPVVTLPVDRRRSGSDEDATPQVRRATKGRGAQPRPSLPRKVERSSASVLTAAASTLRSASVSLS